MNNYIIDPAVFYWINVCSILQTVLAAVGSFLLVVGIVFVFCHYCEKDEAIDKEYDRETCKYVNVINHDKMTLAKTLKMWAVLLCTFGIIFIIASIFIPGKVTSIEMLVARTATFDNVNMTVDGIKELVDYIINAIKSAV